MITNISHHPQIAPIFLEGTNNAGVLVVHGFTGTPDSVRPLVHKLHETGFTVSAPLLPGHGTSPEDLKTKTAKDWFSHVEKSFFELKEKVDTVFVAGLSMGALLTLKLAALHKNEMKAIACLATPLFLHSLPSIAFQVVWNSPLRFFYKYQKKKTVDMKDEEAKKNFWNYEKMPVNSIAEIVKLQKEVGRNLSKIEAPLLLVHAKNDSVAPYSSMNKVAGLVSSSVIEKITLENSYHLVTLDFEKDIVAQKVSEFFERFL